MAKRLSRSEVPEELTWNLADLFPNDSAWESELKGVAAEIGTITQYLSLIHIFTILSIRGKPSKMLSAIA